MKRWLLPLALAAAVVTTGFVVIAETPVRADSCQGTCTAKVPAGCFAWGVTCIPGPGGTWNCARTCISPAYVYTTSNCVLMGPPNTGAPCACPYEGQLSLSYNSCPDHKP